MSKDTYTTAKAATTTNPDRKRPAKSSAQWAARKNAKRAAKRAKSVIDRTRASVVDSILTGCWRGGSREQRQQGGSKVAARTESVVVKKKDR